jgi:putative N6-adenine-specific DNA methylase
MELSVLETGFGKVRFKADLEGCYRALMGLRAADRILWEAARFHAEDFDALFEGIRNAPWEQFIPKNMGLVVDKVRSNRSKLRALTSIQGVAHRAAAERLGEKYHIGRLPEEVRGEIRIYVEKDEVQALLDLSGDPLFKRGYRIEGGIAPLRETTAAALLLLANWRRKFPLYDPFCGSGTILIEAAMYAWDMAPGLGRNFSLSAMVPANPEIERAVRERYLERVDFTRIIRIAGSDADPRAVSIAKSNLIRAYELARGEKAGRGIRVSGFDASAETSANAASETSALAAAKIGAAMPEFLVLRQKEAKALWDEPGFIVTNPPYGIRLGEPEEAELAYRDMAGLAGRFPGWKLALITDHPGFESHFGKKANSCREITNGAVGSYFYQYETL